MKSAGHVRLSAYLLDLLDDGERSRVEDLLESDPVLRQELEELRALARQWSEDDTDHPFEEQIAAAMRGGGDTRAGRSILEHILECRECRFVASVTLAGQEPAASPPRAGAAEARARSRGRRRGLLPAGAAIAASLLLVSIGSYWLGRGDKRDVEIQSIPVVLDARRSSTQTPSIRLSDLTAEGVTFVGETRIEGRTAMWLLTSTEGRVVAEGALLFPPDRPILRSYALYVPRSKLTEVGDYLLVIRAADGEILQQLPVTIDP